MNPLHVVMALQGLTSLGSLFARDNSQADMLALAKRLLDPTSIGAETDKAFAAWNTSPAAAGARQSALSGAYAGQNTLTSSFAQRGLLGTGLGGALPLGMAAGGLKLSEINAEQWQTLWQQIRQNRLAQLGVGSSVQPRFTGLDKLGNVNDMLTRLMLALAMSGRFGKQTQQPTGTPYESTRET